MRGYKFDVDTLRKLEGEARRLFLHLLAGAIRNNVHHAMPLETIIDGVEYEIKILPKKIDVLKH